mmetsp:Transcript_8747/g.19243  ORF Transcript_8747/g.19243 Transcript_8747/m.19243 type:complete len:300 (+) Transcript_8747:829-1728(+)
MLHAGIRANSATPPAIPTILAATPLPTRAVRLGAVAPIVLSRCPTSSCSTSAARSISSQISTTSASSSFVKGRPTVVLPATEAASTALPGRIFPSLSCTSVRSISFPMARTQLRYADWSGTRSASSGNFTATWRTRWSCAAAAHSDRADRWRLDSTRVAWSGGEEDARVVRRRSRWRESARERAARVSDRKAERGNGADSGADSRADPGSSSLDPSSVSGGSGFASDEFISDRSSSSSSERSSRSSKRLSVRVSGTDEDDGTNSTPVWALLGAANEVFILKENAGRNTVSRIDAWMRRM